MPASGDKRIALVLGAGGARGDRRAFGFQREGDRAKFGFKHHADESGGGQGADAGA